MCVCARMCIFMGLFENLRVVCMLVYRFECVCMRVYEFECVYVCVYEFV